MTFKIDLHVHTRWSGDNYTEPEDAMEHAIGAGLQGIAFTEHYYFGISEYAERLKEKYAGRILILRGVEFSAAEGHCLIFGADTDPLGLTGAPISQVISAVTRLGGAVIPSHPYRGGSGIGDKLFDLNGITAIEGHNGANIHPQNLRAVEAAAKAGLPYTGGSDAHSPGEVGLCFTEFDRPVTYENFLRVLKSGGYRGVDARKTSRFGL